MINNLFFNLIVGRFLSAMGLFLQKQDFVFCKGEGLVVTFSGNRNTLMDCHIGFKGMVACRLYNGISFLDRLVKVAYATKL